MAAAEFDFVVIGGGVLGTFHALAASRRGQRTCLLERRDLPRAASVRNFGMIIPSGMTAGPWLRRAQRSVAIYDSLQQQVDIGLRQGGTTYLASSTAEWDVLEEFTTHESRADRPCQLLTADELSGHHPAVRTSHIRGGLHFPDDRRVEPRRLFATLLPWLAESGQVDFRPNTSAVRIEALDRGHLLHCADGSRLAARHVVLCGGHELATLLPDVFADAGLRYCQLQMLSTRPLSDQRWPASLATGMSLRRYPAFAGLPAGKALQPTPAPDLLVQYGIHILAVQDAAGRIVLGDSHSYSDSLPNDIYAGDIERVILEEAARWLSVPLEPVERRWLGVYLVCGQEEIFCRRLPPSLHIVTGIGGKGMTVGPGLAEEMVDRILAGNA